MIFSILRMDIRDIIAIIFAIITAMTVNGFSHALIAKKLGDNSKDIEDRLTLNPLVHVSPLGFLALLLLGFGWAKPVNVNQSIFRNNHKGKILYAFGGLIGNFGVALFSAIIIKFIVPNTFILNLLTSGDGARVFSAMMYMFFYYTLMYNVVFLVFNILPIPPLDGAIIYESILKGRAYELYMKYYQWSQFVLLVLVFTGMIGVILNPLISLVVNVISIITQTSFPPPLV